MRKDEYFERGRDAFTGRFMSVKQARANKRTAVVERVRRKKSKKKGGGGGGRKCRK